MNWLNTLQLAHMLMFFSEKTRDGTVYACSWKAECTGRWIIVTVAIFFPNVALVYKSWYVTFMTLMKSLVARYHISATWSPLVLVLSCHLTSCIFPIKLIVTVIYTVREETWWGTQLEGNSSILFTSIYGIHDLDNDFFHVDFRHLMFQWFIKELEI